MRSNVIPFIKPQKDPTLEVIHNWIEEMPLDLWGITIKEKKLLHLFVEKKILSKKQIKNSGFKQDNTNRLFDLRFVSYYDIGIDQEEWGDWYHLYQLDITPPEPKIKFSFEDYEPLLNPNILNLPNSYLNRTAKAITLCNSSESCLELIWDKGQPTFGEIIDFLEWPYTTASLKRAWAASNQVANLISLLNRECLRSDTICEVFLGYLCTKWENCLATEECERVYGSSFNRSYWQFNLDREMEKFEEKKESQKWAMLKYNQKSKLRLPPGISQGTSFKSTQLDQIKKR